MLRLKLEKFLGAKSKAQGIVEFALVIPLLLTLLFGIFEAGRMLWIYSAVASASREAARFGSTVSDNGSGTPFYLDCAAIRESAKRIGEPGQVLDVDITITYDDGPTGNLIGACPVSPDSIELGDRVVVTVIGHFDPAPAIPLFNFPTFDITSVSRRTIIKGVDLSGAGGAGSATSTSNGPTNTPGGPTNTPAPTNTPGTPTITLTPSQTPTVTNTPACNITGGPLQFGGKEIEWALTNHGSQTEVIVRIVFEWIDTPSNQYYDRMYFDGRIHNGDDDSPGTDVTGEWQGGEERRYLNPSSTETLKIVFGQTHPNNGIAITVYFASGCSVSVGSSSSPTPTGTAGPTLTPSATPEIPLAPLLYEINWTNYKDKECKDIEITVQPNPAWSTSPGSSPSTYQVFFKGSSKGTIPALDPANTTWDSGEKLKDNKTENFGIIALFAGPLGSQELSLDLHCSNGILTIE